ncbi:PorV/PorQ family protein [bacterium]|nr:PorV/PorQ family protein [bacterium]
MYQCKRLIYVCVCVLTFLACQATAEDSGYRLDNLAWLKLSLTSCAHALGGAFTARPDDGAAVYWNPAFLDELRPYEVQISAMALPMTLERRAAFASYIVTLPKGYGSVGVSWQHNRIGAIEVRTAGGQLLGATEDFQNAFALAYGLTLNPEWKVGAALKYYHHQVAGEYGQGVGLDIAGYFNPKKEWSQWAFGAVLRNMSPGLVWSTGRQESVYPTLRLGGVYKFASLPLTTSLDIEIPRAWKIIPHTGIEWQVWDFVAIRGGLDTQGIYGGVGYRFRTWQLDYAYGIMIDGLSDTHRLTMILKL